MISQDKIDKILALRDEGQTVRQICTQVGVSSYAVTKYCGMHGRKTSRRGPRIQEDKIKRILELRDEGKTIRQIALAAEVSMGTVANYLRDNGKTNNAPKGVTDEEIQIMRQMRSEGCTFEQIRLRVNRATSTIRDVITDIPKPPKPKQQPRYVKVVNIGPSREALPVRLQGEKLVDSIDCGCKVCHATISVDMPDDVDSSHVHYWAIHTTVTCESCNTCFLVSDVIPEGNIALALGYLKDRGPCYVGNDRASI